MNVPKASPEVLLIGGAVLLVAGYVFFRGFKGAAADVSGAVVNTAAGVVQGAAIATGSIVGIPQTNEQLCELACANGDSMNASFYCSAGRYLQYLWNGK